MLLDKMFISYGFVDLICQDDMLKSVVKKILKTADLEEVTMKTVCKQVCWLPSNK